MKGDKLYLHSFFVKKTEKMLLEGFAKNARDVSIVLSFRKSEDWEDAKFRSKIPENNT